MLLALSAGHPQAAIAELCAYLPTAVTEDEEEHLLS